MKNFCRSDRKKAILTAILAAAAVAACDKNNGGTEIPQKGPSPYVTRVFEYRPAPGQFVNELPQYAPGDTQETMNRKALEAIGENRRGLISLGGFGGYVVVGFDHTIENREGLCDFRVLGNAFYSTGQTEYGSSEPGVIQVAADENGNGIPDDTWYEIAGSSHLGREEKWLDEARKAGNDTRTIAGYEITYVRPDDEPQGPVKEYIRWRDNQGEEGYRAKIAQHRQPYFPLWIGEKEISFRGTRLPQNGIRKGEPEAPGSEEAVFALYKFAFGYADNEPNASDRSAIDIGWAVDEQGRPANLTGIDFVRIHSGVNQENGWLGECSTEVAGVTDLHLTNVRIESKTISGPVEGK